MEVEKKQLAWGLQPPEGASIAWGGRAIFERRYVRAVRRGRWADDKLVIGIDLLGDRQDSFGDPKDLVKLLRWVNTKGIRQIKKQIEQDGIDTSQNIHLVCRDEKLGYVLVANPRASYGYLYLCAYQEG